MRLFNEYIVGAVNRKPFLFTVSSGDITFLEQFPAEYWVDALWLRYNTVLYSSLRNREIEREKAGYNEFVQAKYHEILKNLESVDLDLQIKKKRALLQAINLAEERFYHINVRNRDIDFTVRALNYSHGRTERKTSEAFIKANSYIEELVKSLEVSPMNPQGYDLTNVRIHNITNEQTKSKFSSRGFQFPSRDTIRKALRRWIEFTGADLHHLPPVAPKESEKKDFINIDGTEVNELYEKHWWQTYFNFFRNLSSARNLITWYSANRELYNRMISLIRDENIEELARSVKGAIGIIQYIKDRILEISVPATRLKGLTELQTYLRDRSRNKYLSIVLSKSELRIARRNNTFVDPHNRFPRYSAETNSDEKLPPRIKMKQVKVMRKKNRRDSYGEPEIIEIPDLQRGRMLYPIHDRPDLQDSEYATGNLHRYEDLHLPQGQKGKYRPFMWITPDSFKEDPSLKKNLRIISGGLIPNQDSPQRSGVIATESGFLSKIQNIRSILDYKKYNFETSGDGVLQPVLTEDGNYSMSRLVVNYLEKKLKTTKTEKAHGAEFTFEWSEWHKCMNEIDYKRLHDHCAELLTDNYIRVKSDPVNEVKKILNDLFTRMIQLDFGCGTFKQRRLPVFYDCNRIKHIINRFYSGAMFIEPATEGEEADQGRLHDVANRAEYRNRIADADGVNPNRLQLFSRLVVAYTPKFSGPDARTSAELCASSFINGVTRSGKDLDSAVETEIVRLGTPDADANCTVASTRIDYKQAYLLLQQIRNGMKPAISLEDMQLLIKFANPESTVYNRAIQSLVKTIENNNQILESLLQSISDFRVGNAALQSNLSEKYDVMNNLHTQVFTINESIRKKITNILKLKKMSSFPQIKNALQRLIS
jgi:hypothetical protein